MSSSRQSRPRGARPLRIGYVLKRFPRLSETFVLNELLELERQGVAVEVFSLKKPLDEPRHELLAHLAAPVHYVSAAPCATPEARPSSLLAALVPGKEPEDRAALWRKALAIASLARERGLQHLHAHFASDAASAALLAGRRARLPFSFTAHARDIYHCYVSREVDDDARRLKVRSAQFVATVSEYNREYLERMTQGRGWIVRLYNGIDLARFAPDGGPPGASRTLLCVGRLVEKKGIGDLIEACRLLALRGERVECDIVGDGPLRDELAKRIADAGLADAVRLHGALPQEAVLALMRRAGAMVLPCVVSASGDQDGLPTVLLEALAAGLPAISTRVAGIPEIIEHERSGLLVEPGAPAQLADAIARLIASPALSAQLAAGGRERAEQLFDLGRNVSSLRQLFHASIQASARGGW